MKVEVAPEAGVGGKRCCSASDVWLVDGLAWLTGGWPSTETAVELEVVGREEWIGIVDDAPLVLGVKAGASGDVGSAEGPCS